MKLLKTLGLGPLFALLALGTFNAGVAGAVEGLSPAADSSGSGGAVVLETLSKETISCKTIAVLEVIFSAKSNQAGTANLHLEGCLASGLFGAQTLLDEKEVILIKVVFLLCLVNSAALTFGLALEPTETAHIEVPAVGALLLLKGIVIAELESSSSGTELSWKLEGKAGDQTIATKCTINGNSFSHTLAFAKDNESTDSMASAKALFKLKYAQTVSLVDS